MSENVQNPAYNSSDRHGVHLAGNNTRIIAGGYFMSGMWSIKVPAGYAYTVDDAVIEKEEYYKEGGLLIKSTENGRYAAGRMPDDDAAVIFCYAGQKQVGSDLEEYADVYYGLDAEDTAAAFFPPFSGARGIITNDDRRYAGKIEILFLSTSKVECIKTNEFMHLFVRKTADTFRASEWFFCLFVRHTNQVCIGTVSVQQPIPHEDHRKVMLQLLESIEVVRYGNPVESYTPVIDYTLNRGKLTFNEHKYMAIGDKMKFPVPDGCNFYNKGDFSQCPDFGPIISSDRIDTEADASVLQNMLMRVLSKANMLAWWPSGILELDSSVSTSDEAEHAKGLIRMFDHLSNIPGSGCFDDEPIYIPVCTDDGGVLIQVHSRSNSDASAMTNQSSIVALINTQSQFHYIRIVLHFEKSIPGEGRVPDLDARTHDLYSIASQWLGRIFVKPTRGTHSEEKHNPEIKQGIGKLIPKETPEPGRVYTVSRARNGLFGVYHLEARTRPGNGRFTYTGMGPNRDSAESLQTASEYFKANGNALNMELDPGYLKPNGNVINKEFSITAKDYIVNYSDLNGAGQTKHLSLPTLIAISSTALAKPVLPGLAVLGDITVSGEELKVEDLENVLQVCVENGAEKVLIPMSSSVDLCTVSPELFDRLNIIFYPNARSAILSALGLLE